LSEFVEGGLKQREMEVRRREVDMIKRERQLQDEEEIELALEEKKLEEDERRLQRLRDDLSKSKQSHRDDLEKLSSQRTLLRQQNDLDLNK